MNKFLDDIEVIWDKETKLHTFNINFKKPIIDDSRYQKKNGKFIIKKGVNSYTIPPTKIGRKKYESKKRNLKNKSVSSNSSLSNYSTVIDFLTNELKKDDYFILFSFKLTSVTSKLTKTTHYSELQQNIFDTIKYLKEEEGLGYRKISHRLKEMGMKSVRSKKELKYNYVFSIYKKGKIREERINREFKDRISEINFQLFER